MQLLTCKVHWQTKFVYNKCTCLLERFASYFWTHISNSRTTQFCVLMYVKLHQGLFYSIAALTTWWLVLRETLSFEGNTIDWFPEGPVMYSTIETWVNGSQQSTLAVTECTVTLQLHIFCNVACSETFGRKQFYC